MTIQLEEWQVRLILRIMNTAAPHYPRTTTDRMFDEIGTLRSELEAHVGTIDDKIE